MNITSETLNILFLLVPGFISWAIFRCIIPCKHKEQIRFIFEVLSFGLVDYFIVSSFYRWEAFVRIENNTILFNANTQIGLTFLFSIIIPVLLSYIFARDIHIKILRFLKISYNTNRISAWHDAFSEQNRYLRVHLKDGRCIEGHPMYFTGTDEGHRYIYLELYNWLDSEYYPIENNNMHGILLDDDQIDFIEFYYNKT